MPKVDGAELNDHGAPAGTERSERRFKALVEHSVDAITLIDAAGLVIYEGPTVERLTGYRSEERLGRNGFALVHPDDHDRLRQAMGRVMAEPGRIETAEFRSVRKDGSTWWTRGTAVNLLSDPEVGAIVVNYYDVSEHRATLDALRESEAKFKAVFETVREAVFITDPDTGLILEHNGKLSGYSREEAIGRTTVKLGFWENQADRERFSAEYRKKGFVEDLEVTRRLPSGAQGTVSASAAPIALDGKRCILTVLRDVTERKREEAERLELERQAQRAQRLESLAILAGGIAHDFNNLLGGLYGFIDLARLEEMSLEAASRLDAAMGTLERARGLTQQLLTFAKGGSPLRKPGRLFPWLEEAVLFGLSGSSIGCSFQADSGLWPCDFDRAQIGQVVDNLVINAVQAMPAGGSIRVEAANAALGEGQVHELPAGRYVRVSVADTGIGIPAEILGRIFDPFFTTKQKGSGLGLATSYSIIKRHDGDILAESSPGRGSTFSFFLRAAELPPADEAPLRAPGRAAPGCGTILMMDDEEGVRAVIQAMLYTLGYSALAAQDGEEAIKILMAELAAGRRPVAAILDLTVKGGMGGKECAVRIKEIDPNLPLFVASGYADDPVMADPRAHGFCGRLAKPFVRAELAAELERCGKDRG